MIAPRFLLLPCLLGGIAYAQLPEPTPQAIVGARMPALSPDGKTLAFVWQGDIWVAPATGGDAYAVTSHVDYDAYPIFSPDGKWIAFQSNRTGSSDIWVVPTRGGIARQLTFASARESPTDWSPDGKSILYVTQYDRPFDGIFTLDVATGRFTRLSEDYKALNRPSYSPDGKRLTFERKGFPWTRPRYNGYAAAQLWTLDTTTGTRRTLADNGRQHLFPHYLPDGKSIVCVTVGEETPNSRTLDKPLPPLVDNERRTPNLWVFPENGGKPQQRTRFVGGAVRFPTVARQTGDIVFEYERDLYRLAAGSNEPQKLTLRCSSDDKLSALQRFRVENAEVDEAEISPDGKTFAFLLRNDLWTIPLEKAKSRNANDATRLTTYPGFDRDFNWSKDNKTLFFVSDRDGNDRVFALDVASKAVKPVWTGKADANSPQLSPDGKTLLFRVDGTEQEGGGLYTCPSDLSAPPKRLLAIAGSAQGEVAWSPDLQWLAYIRRGTESGGRNLWLVRSDGSGTPINVTRLNAAHSQPVWSADGRYLYFTSDRDGANALYALPLRQEDARSDELELKYQKPTAPVALQIDFLDLTRRIRRLNAPSPDWDLQFSENDGLLYFVSGGDIWTSSYDGKENRRLTGIGGITHLRLNPAGTTAYFRSGGRLYMLATKVPGAQPALVTFVASGTQDQKVLRQVAFNQLWRSYANRFYDPQFHGRDWSAIRQRYEPLLAAVGTREEMANLGNLMLGELEASHSEVGPAAGGTPSPNTQNLGVYFDYSYAGPGIKIAGVPLRAPGSFAKTRLNPGEYIVAIDGTDVTLDQNLFQLLNEKADRDLVLTVNTKPDRDGARTVTYKALNDGEWRDIHYRNRIDSRVQQVETVSQGKLAYVHISGMGGSNQTTFEREFYEYAEGKDGIIIDVRENGGGNIGDTLISWLNIKPYGTTAPRNGYTVPSPWAVPHRPFNKPVIVLMADSSFSNAEMFPYGMRATGLAKLVGEPTPGYVIWTSGLPLIDGTSARMPFAGSYRKDGTSLENLGEKPDYFVPWATEDYFAGKDPQLDKAISLLLKK